MISVIKKKGHSYYCSNCMMRQLDLRPNCIFCGNMFSNYEDRLMQEDAEQFILNNYGELKEIDTDENNICRTNRET